MKRAWTLVTAVALAGCAGEAYRNPEKNPFQNMKRVAVAPVMNLTTEKVDGMEAANALASELLLHPGFEVIRPADFVSAARELGIAPSKAEDYLTVARHLGADAVVVAAVTEHRSYYPPRVTIATQWLLTQRVTTGAADLERIIRSGKPLALDTSTAPSLGLQAETVFDASDDNVRADAEQYAAARVEEESPWQGAEAVLRVRARYFRFVCASLVRSLIDTERARQEAARPKRRDGP